ncbi:MAG: aspartate aminotransferase family protein [Hyphomicrobiales bacterium]|nr:aspartate aminotransferase family protein [Hyphomicrobiales bacterium]
MKNTTSLFDTYVYPEPQFVRGVGVRLFDANGQDYLDFSSGIAVNSLGHAHPHLVSALKLQAENLWHTSNLYAIPGREKLADRLCHNSFADKVFFTNSGAEALECAIKTTRHYHFEKGDKNRVNILTFEGAFHGRTLATIAAGGKQQYLEGFGPKTQGFIQLPFGDAEAVDGAIDETTAGILIEPIMGEGGIRAHSNKFLRHLRRKCDEHDIVLIYDEVQTGVARTGKLFAYQWSGVEPDVMALAKGLGGGFPMGACLARGSIAASMSPGTHGSTFGGNPLAMAVANAVLDVILGDGFLDHVNKMSGRFKQYLSEFLDTYPDLFDEIRGEGLLLGLKCKVPNTQVTVALRENGVLVVPAGDNVIRLLPPLIINEDELGETCERMEEAFAQLAE